MKPGVRAAPSPDRVVLAGLVERVTFHNPENGFCVLRTKARGHRDLVTVVGHAAMVGAGEWITASGEWINDRTHGHQFKARFVRTSTPSSVEGGRVGIADRPIRGRRTPDRHIRGAGSAEARGGEEGNQGRDPSTALSAKDVEASHNQFLADALENQRAARRQGIHPYQTESAPRLIERARELLRLEALPWDAHGDGDGEVEREEGLPHFGSPPTMPTAWRPQEPVDEPLLLARPVLQLDRRPRREAVHRHALGGDYGHGITSMS